MESSTYRSASSADTMSTHSNESDEVILVLDDSHDEDDENDHNEETIGNSTRSVESLASGNQIDLVLRNQSQMLEVMSRQVELATELIQMLRETQSLSLRSLSQRNREETDDE